MITALIRTILLYCILMVGLRLMGKRQIGELEPSELVLTLIISDLAAVPMQDFGIPLINGVLPIVTLLCLSMLVSCLSLHSLKFRSLICGHPTILIRNGQVEQAAMTRNRYTADELLEQLRAQGFSQVSAVKYAILETNGSLSVFPFSREAPTTPKGLGIDVPDDITMPVTIISDGRVIQRSLKEAGRNMSWLEKELAARNLPSPRSVFLLTVDEQGSVVCITKE